MNGMQSRAHSTSSTSVHSDASASVQYILLFFFAILSSTNEHTSSLSSCLGVCVCVCVCMCVCVCVVCVWCVCVWAGAMSGVTVCSVCLSWWWYCVVKKFIQRRHACLCRVRPAFDRNACLAYGIAFHLKRINAGSLICILWRDDIAYMYDSYYLCSCVMVCT